jgi:H+/Cl- antiporter ClcA
MDFIEKQELKDFIHRLLILLKWITTGIVTGIIVGGIGIIFYFGIHYATVYRQMHGWIICLLPLAGLLIVFMYHRLNDYDDKGTNLVIDSIQQSAPIPLRKAPLIFISTVVTHLFGGSAGRESAALQIGGCIGQNLGRLFHFNEGDQKIITMCGMSAAFSALFGTPMAAAFLAMEIESVGIMYYAALVPCVLSALVATYMARHFGVTPDVFSISNIPDFTINHAFFASVLALLCALVSILFCIALHKSSELYQKYLKNPYLRIFVGGCFIVILTFISGTQLYNGAGMNVIEMATNGDAPDAAFLLKILFTVLTLGAGYKGGEIVPSLYIGATFGCLFANLGGFNPALCSAIGMGALFCSVTNCPISSLLLCFELFGYAGMPYYLIAIALSYAFSGYYSVYSSQKIVYSKFRNKYVNRDTK